MGKCCQQHKRKFSNCLKKFTSHKWTIFCQAQKGDSCPQAHIFPALNLSTLELPKIVKRTTFFCNTTWLILKINNFFVKFHKGPKSLWRIPWPSHFIFTSFCFCLWSIYKECSVFSLLSWYWNQYSGCAFILGQDFLKKRRGGKGKILEIRWG